MRKEIGEKLLSGSMVTLPILAVILGYSKNSLLDLSLLILWCAWFAAGAMLFLIDNAETAEEG